MGVNYYKMKYFDTFTGIGGFTLAIENNIKGAECVGFSEIDKYASSIYQKHYPNHKNYGDITKINTEELPDFDLLVGGFPCQAFSIAGKRKGFEDTRGTMFFELARILRDKQPRLFVFENVKGLLSHDKGNTFKTIISTIDELGYDCQWQVLNSKNFGVPQNRERVFIVGHLRGTPRPKVFPIRQNDKENTESRQVCTSATVSTRTGSTAGGQQFIKQVGTRKDSNSGTQPYQQDRVYDTSGISPALQQALPEGGHKIKITETISQPFIRNPYNGKQSEVETGTLGTSCGSSTGKTAQHLYKDSTIRRLTPVECERLQGFPDNWTEGISDTQRYKCCGNAVTVNVVEEIIKKLL